MKFDMNTFYLIIVIATAIFGIIKVVAPKTKTKIDDRFVEKVENIKSWAHAVAPHLWAIVEVLGSKGVIDNTGPSKMNEFMKRLEAETEAVHGEKLPSQAAAAAKLVAEGLSAADHLLDPQEASDGEMD